MQAYTEEDDMFADDGLSLKQPSMTGYLNEELNISPATGQVGTSKAQSYPGSFGMQSSKPQAIQLISISDEDE